MTISAWRKKLMLFFILFCPVSLSLAQESLCNSEYKGQVLDQARLSSILASHARLPLNLGGATLSHANLKNLQLNSINLCRTDISFSELQNSNLSYANLGHAFLQASNLSNGNLEHADLEQANLSNSQLHNASLKYANLKNANLGGADLEGADLSVANLEGANLTNAKLNGADLRFANLKNTDLSNANLQDANLEGAFLISANLDQAILKNTNLMDVDLKDAIYQPKLNNLPDLISFLSVKNLRYIYFQNVNNSRAALTELRNAYMILGMRAMEHYITSTIKYHEMISDWERGGWHSLESALGYVFFYVTCDYGADPIRPIKILLMSILFFSIPYRVALSKASKHAGIMSIWAPRRFYHWNKIKRVESLPFFFSKLLNNRFIGREQCGFEKQCRLLSLAIFFSLLSTFSIGWKEINVGNWISHLQAREYTLKGKGWVRAVAGFQSLLCAYLIVLWILCYFGRPFEW